MNSDEYYYCNCLGLLEDKLPPEMFIEVKKYLMDESVEQTGKTQAERVLNHLYEHGSITNMQCHLLYGIRHCPSVIRDAKKKLLLENSLYEIDTKPAKGCNRYGEKTNWVVYFLKEKAGNYGRYEQIASAYL